MDGKAIEVRTADGLPASFQRTYGRVLAPLDQANGRILQESLRADRAYSPIDRVCMDGIAIAFDAWKAGAPAFRVEGLAPRPIQGSGDFAGLGDTDGFIELPENRDTFAAGETVEFHDWRT